MTDHSGTHVDVIIVGQGLAGSALALTLIERGLRVQVIDGDTRGAASRVAAGLITPVTGAKLKPQPDFENLMATATAHYRHVEALSGATVLTQRAALRLLHSERELRAWHEADKTLMAHMQTFGGALPDGLSTNGLVTCMPAAARLDAAAYVVAVRAHLQSLDAFIAARIEPAEVVVASKRVSIPRLGISATRLVFCRGFADRSNPFFESLAWRPAKGQILTIRCDTLGASGTVHANGLWITPRAEGEFLVGATYEWDALDDVATQAARQDIEARLAGILEADYQVIEQAAGVRPIVQGRMPVVGESPETARILLMNGLGSKGALFAPTVAQTVSAYVLDQEAIEPRFNLSQRVAGSE